MNKKLNADRDNINLELRSLSDKVKAGTIKAADAAEQLKELRARKAANDKEIANANAPANLRSTQYADIANAMKENRAITINGTGAINQIKELVKILTAKTPLLQKVRYFYGANASTNIPVFTATPARPAAQAEGAKEIANDVKAAMGNKALTPYAFVSILPITAEAIRLGSIDIESELDGIFADAFADAFHNGIANGTGLSGEFTGLFTGVDASNVTTSTGDTLKMQDLVNLALQIQDKTDSGVIIMNSAVYSTFMADTTDGIDVYKESLARDKKIEGVSVVLTSAAPNSVASGSTVAIAGDLKDYGMAVAGELEIEPIKVLGDTHTYFQATMYANGSPIIAKNFYGLAVK